MSSSIAVADRLPSISTASQESRGQLSLLPVILYFIVEYAKPPLLAPLKPGLVLSCISVLFLIGNFGKLLDIARDKFAKLYALLIVLMMIHVPIAANNYHAYNFFIGALSTFGFSLAICLFMGDIHKLKAGLTWFVVVLAICAVAQFTGLGNSFGGSGILKDENDLALAMNVAMPIAFYLGLSFKGLRRWCFLLLTVFFVAANVVTMSRGGFLGMAAVWIACWLNSRHKVRAFVAAVTLLLVFAALIPEEYRAELVSITEEGSESGTGRERVEYWKVAWRTFADNPAIGVGQGNLPWTIGHYQKFDDGYWGRSIGGRASHSIYFTLLPELGVVGAILWLLMIGNFCRKYRKLTVVAEHGDGHSETSDRRCLYNCASGLVIALVGYLVTGFFLSVLYYPYFWNLCAFMTAAYLVSLKQADAPDVKQGKPSNQSALRNQLSRTVNIRAF